MKTGWTKASALAHWMTLTKKVNPLRFMRPIPYKASGSSYGTCGIRIDGTPEFIDAVLSHLTELMDGENAITRLELSRSEVDHAAVKTDGSKHGNDKAEVCYIRLHTRGAEGQMLQAMTDRDGVKRAEKMLDLFASA